MKPSWHYYEAHISLEDNNLVYPKRLKETLERIDFQITDIVTMPVDGLEQEEFDYIITSRGTNLKEFTQKVLDAVITLQKEGYNVLRYKIESTIIDSKYEDKFNLLGT
jgi:hypothetical protein